MITGTVGLLAAPTNTSSGGGGGAPWWLFAIGAVLVLGFAAVYFSKRQR